MRRALRSIVGSALVLPLLGVLRFTPLPNDVSPELPAELWLAQASCAVCHPGAVKALRYSTHAGLLTDPATRDRACAACHGDQTAHAQTALDPQLPLLRPEPVTAAACATCHAGRALTPDQGAHPWSAQLDRVAGGVPGGVPASETNSAPAGVRDTARALEDSALFGMDFGLLARAGYRFVNVFGSRARYETDVNLDGGVRLTDFELDARGRPGAILDRANVTVSDLADPFTRVRAELARDAVAKVKGRYQRDIFKYRARGDFHRVDVRAEEWGTDLEVALPDDAALLASFTRRLQDGFWLTNRIGNRNVNPQTTIAGVQSPRDHDLELYEVGLRTEWLGAPATLTGEYRNLRDVDSFAYSRPAPVNPAFPESEDFTSASTLRGPGARLQVADANDKLAFGFTAHVVSLERRIRGNGIARGFDISDFETTTTAFASGEATTWVLDGTLDYTASDTVHLLGDLRWRDHEEELHVDQVDVTRYPNLGNSTTTALDLNQRTAQRALEGSVSLQLDPFEGLRLSAGWGFVRERLRVPDLELGDPDFVVGDIDNDGVLLDASWRPSARWVVSGRYRDYGQNGLQLHELSDDEVRTWKAKVRHQRDRWWVEVFSEQRRRDNAISSTALDAWTSGVSVNHRLGEKGDVWANFAYTDLESRTLTNFYFDPSPTPVPTFVGFDGITHSAAAGVGWDLAPRVRLDVSGSYTSTSGTFAVQVFDWRADLCTRVCSSGDVGIMVRQVDYREDLQQSGGLDDYGSYLTFVYFRTMLGTLRDR